MNIGDCVRVANQNSTYKEGIGVITGSFAGNWVVYFIEIDLEVVFGEWELIKLCDLRTFLALAAMDNIDLKILKSGVRKLKHISDAIAPKISPTG